MLGFSKVDVSVPAETTFAAKVAAFRVSKKRFWKGRLETVDLRFWKGRLETVDLNRQVLYQEMTTPGRLSTRKSSDQST